ncbi:GL13733 [Drosophila persimilis]|uniref:GL13733 n=2 Tax=Drosophila persimilis TaxID=7234 RepID=B4GNS5_DROPE|nr:GL13733 [Drosophila persimilis]
MKEAESIKSILSAKNLDEEERKLSTRTIIRTNTFLGWSNPPKLYLLLFIVFNLIKIV